MTNRRAVTPSQTVGPFFGFALPFEGDHRAIDRPGPEALRIEGTLSDGSGQPISDALLEVWSSEQFSRCRTDPEGAFRFVISRPTSRGGEAPHLDVLIFARGLLRQLATRIYLPDAAAANANDPVLREIEDERRSTLIAQVDGEVLRFDIRLQGESETVFFAI